MNGYGAFVWLRHSDRTEPTSPSHHGSIWSDHKNTTAIFQDLYTTRLTYVLSGLEILYLRFCDVIASNKHLHNGLWIHGVLATYVLFCADAGQAAGSWNGTTYFQTLSKKTRDGNLSTVSSARPKPIQDLKSDVGFTVIKGELNNHKNCTSVSRRF